MLTPYPTPLRLNKGSAWVKFLQIRWKSDRDSDRDSDQDLAIVRLRPDIEQIESLVR